MDEHNGNEKVIVPVIMNYLALKIEERQVVSVVLILLYSEAHTDRYRIYIKRFKFLNENFRNAGTIH